MTTLNYTWQKTTFTKHTALCRRKPTPTDFEQYVTAASLAVYKLVTDLQSFTQMMASAQVVETSVNTNNSPSQDYTTNPDDHSNHNIDSPGFKPFTVISN